MPKPLCTHWFLQQIADRVVAEMAPGFIIVPVVQHHDEEIVWDEDCKGVGRVPWFCGYFISPEDGAARALVTRLNAALAPYQALYDLGVSCDC